MKYLWDKDTHKWVEPHVVLCKRASQARSDHHAPIIIRTGLDYVWNPVNGRHYTCRRNYEKDVIASGNRIVGNDLDLTEARRPEIKLDAKQDIARAFEQHS